MMTTLTNQYVAAGTAEVHSFYEALSVVTTLTIDDLLRYPRFRWSRPHLSKDLTLRHEELDTLHRQGKIQLVGQWRDVVSDQQWTVDDYRNQSSLTVYPSEWLRLELTAPIEEILTNRDLYWDWSILSDRSDITIEFLVRHEATSLPWDWTKISENADFSQVFRYPDLPYRREGFSDNPGITVDFMIRIDRFIEVKGDWDYGLLSRRLPLPSDPSQVQEIKWSRYGLSWNPQITLAYFNAVDNDITTSIVDDPNDDWSWKGLSQSIPIDEIIRTIDRTKFSCTGEPGWCMDGIKERPSDEVSRFVLAWMAKTKDKPQGRRQVMSRLWKRVKPSVILRYWEEIDWWALKLHQKLAKIGSGNPMVSVDDLVRLIPPVNREELGLSSMRHQLLTTIWPVDVDVVGVVDRCR